MYCNDNVEDDTYSNCIKRDGIQTSLSRVLHLYGCTPWFRWLGGWRWVWWASLWEGVSPSMDKGAMGASLEQGSMGDKLW